MNKYIINIFSVLYNFYYRHGKQDAYFSASGTFSALNASILNFIMSILYYYSGNQYLELKLFPVGLIFFSTIVISMIYFHLKSELIIPYLLRTKNENMPKTFLVLFILFGFFTWIGTPIIYKIAYQVHTI